MRRLNTWLLLLTVTVALLFLPAFAAKSRTSARQSDSPAAVGNATAAPPTPAAIADAPSAKKRTDSPTAKASNPPQQAETDPPETDPLYESDTDPPETDPLDESDTKPPKETTLNPPSADTTGTPTVAPISYEDDDASVISSTSLIFTAGAFGILIFFLIRSGKCKSSASKKGFERIPLEEVRSSRGSHIEDASPDTPRVSPLNSSSTEGLLNSVMQELGIPEFAKAKYTQVFHDARLTRVDQLEQLDEGDWRRIDVPDVIKKSIRKRLLNSSSPTDRTEGWNLKKENHKRRSSGGSGMVLGLPSVTVAPSKNAKDSMFKAQELDQQEEEEDEGWGDEEKLDVFGLNQFSSIANKKSDVPAVAKVVAPVASSNVKTGLSLKKASATKSPVTGSSKKPSAQEIISDTSGWDMDLEFDSL